MRQLALHPGLVPANYLEQLQATEDQGDGQPPAIHITPGDRVRLQGLLAQMIEDSEECPICFWHTYRPKDDKLCPYVLFGLVNVGSYGLGRWH